MKKLLLPVLIIVPLFINAQVFSFEVAGSAGLEPEAGIVGITYVVGETVVKDSARVGEGRFTFKGQLAAPTKAYLSLPGSRTPDGRTDYLIFYLEKGIIKVDVKKYMKDAVVVAGPENKAYSILAEETAVFTEKQKELVAHYRSLNDDQKNNSHWKAERDSLLEQNRLAKKPVIKKFILTHPSLIVSLDALIEYAGSVPDYPEIHPLFMKLNATVRNTAPGIAYNNRLTTAKLLGIGNIAPGFVQKDTAGKEVSLASFRGKYVLLDFWASWCGPCRAENPNVVKAYLKYKDKGFTVLSVSLDRENDRKKWMDAIHQDQLEWTHVSDLKYWKNEVAVKYGIQAIPQNFLIDPQGKIVAVNLRGPALFSKLQEVIP